MIDSILDKSVELFSLACGCYLAYIDRIQVSEIPSLINTTNNLFDWIHSVYIQISIFFSYTGTLSDIEKLYDLLHLKPKIGIDFPPIENMKFDEKEFKWNIIFENVWFAYPSSPSLNILMGINYEIKEGDRIGILGESGCGKSTFIDLISRLYDPTKGCIYISGKSIRDLNPTWLRRHIAVVSQSSYLPFSTVKENLLYGMFLQENENSIDKKSIKPIKDFDKEMLKALEIAFCDHLFYDTNRFPQQWHSDIGQNGNSLSGGERQRLCLAQAILTKPKILILDEATSALDEELQFQVQEAIQQLYTSSRKRLTVISIAHRLSNFRHVDHLIILEKGRIVEKGSIKELASLESGIFHNFLIRSEIRFNE